MSKYFPVHEKGVGFYRDNAADEPIAAKTTSSGADELHTGKSFCEPQEGGEVKKKHHRVMLLADVEGYFLSHDGDLIKKGGFAKGRLLKLNATFPIVKDGIKYFKVENVKHHFIYIPHEPGTLKKIKGSDIKKMADGVAEKKGIDASNKVVLDKLIDKTVENLTMHLESKPCGCKGLDNYETNAFLNCDGFCYAEGDEKVAAPAMDAPTENIKAGATAAPAEVFEKEKEVVLEVQTSQLSANVNSIDQSVIDILDPPPPPPPAKKVVVPTPAVGKILGITPPQKPSVGKILLRSVIPFYGALESLFSSKK